MELTQEESLGHAPECPKHKKPMHLVLAKPGGLHFPTYAEFACPIEDCVCTARVAQPECKACKRPMRLSEARSRTFDTTALYQWVCCHFDEFELCDCGSVGWLHMDNGCGDPQILGHDGGFHIEACSSCEYLFEHKGDCIEAERAHRRECGCGHGLPTNDQEYDWVDYGGRSGEVYAAMVSAGFRTAIIDRDDAEPWRIIEVHIPAGQADKFIQTFDAVHDKMKKGEKLMVPAPGLPGLGRYFSKNEKSTRQAAKYSSFANTTFKGTAYDFDTDHNRSEEGSMAIFENGEYPIYTPDKDGTPVDTRHVGERANSRRKAEPKFKMEELLKAGVVPVMRKDGSCRLTTEGYPIVVLEDIEQMASRTNKVLEGLIKRQVDEKVTKIADLMTTSVKDINKQAMLLLGQLNEMYFDKFPIEDQRRLESRRRTLLASLTMFADKFGGSNSLERDRSALQGGERVFPYAGGYRIEKLEQECEHAVYHGTTYIDGNYFRVVAVEVHEVNGMQQAVNDPNNWYGDIGQLNDSCMVTTKLPGLQGDFVLAFYPGGV